MNRLTMAALLAGAVAAAAATMVASSSATPTSSRAAQLALAREATAKYANDLGRARADGYRIITRMIPDIGYHYLNPSVKTFDLRKPPILVYVHQGGAKWQLGALEWVFPKQPARPPIPGPRYGVFGAACHYADGTFVFASAKASCARTSPEVHRVACGAVPPDAQRTCASTVRATGARFSFWHGPLVTLHVWLWYPNPDGLFAGMNPLVRPYNGG
jgi:hypothetical protein